MAHARTDTYGFDTVGLRRFIRVGDEIPPGWTVDEQDIANDEVAAKRETKPPAPKRRTAKPKAS
jgi:hypothetical protein